MQGSRRKQTLKMRETGRSLQRGFQFCGSWYVSSVVPAGLGAWSSGTFWLHSLVYKQTQAPSSGEGSGLTQQFWAASVTKAGDNASLRRPGLGAVRQGCIRQTWG